MLSTLNRSLEEGEEEKHDKGKKKRQPRFCFVLCFYPSAVRANFDTGRAVELAHSPFLWLYYVVKSKTA